MQKEYDRVVARAKACGDTGEMSIGLLELEEAIVRRLQQSGYLVHRGKRLGGNSTAPRYLYTVTWQITAQTC